MANKTKKNKTANIFSFGQGCQIGFFDYKFSLFLAVGVKKNCLAYLESVGVKLP